MHELEMLQTLIKAQHDKFVESFGKIAAEFEEPAVMVFVSTVAPVFVQGMFTFDEDGKIIESILIEFDDDGKAHPTDNWGL